MKLLSSICVLLVLALHQSQGERDDKAVSFSEWIRSKRGASNKQCCTLEALDDFAHSIQQNLDILTQSVFEIGFNLQEYINMGLLPKYPTPSCHYLYYAKPGTSSGHYYIGKGKDITAHKMYCNMDTHGSPFGTTQGWMKVADLDMRRDYEQCPEGFKYIYKQGLRLCAKSIGKGCQSIVFPTYGIPYQRLCGRASAFQVGTNNAFHRFQCKDCTIDDPYVDGLSITYDYPRKHIWSLAASWTGYHDKDYRGVCPCATGKGTPAPKFVGDNYFCEVGQYWSKTDKFDENDPLWDGEGCGKDEEACCEAPGLPWFCTDVPGGSHKDIEVRVCADEDKEDVYLQLLDIYVQ